MKKLTIPVLLTVLAVILACVSYAQENRFKVGDRVEVDTFMRGDYPGADKYADWRKATVTGFYSPENRFGGYVVKIDDGAEMHIRFVDTRWIRGLQGADPKATDENKADNQEKPNDVANPEAKPADQKKQNQTAAGACGPSDDLNGTSQTAIFKRLIADRYEKDGMSRTDQVPVTIHFTDFKIGTTHPYRRMVNNPDGPGGVTGGAVYPVKTSYLICADYPGFAKTGFKGELFKPRLN